jgi:hypothetical protein
MGSEWSKLRMEIGDVVKLQSVVTADAADVTRVTLHWHSVRYTLYSQVLYVVNLYVAHKCKRRRMLCNI